MTIYIDYTFFLSIFGPYYVRIRVIMNSVIKRIVYSKIPIVRPPLGLSKTFRQSQRWSQIRGTPCVENDEKNNLNFADKVF